MPVELKVPEVGESITEVEIGEWRKSEGDHVERDEPVVSLETDKASLDLPAPVSGRVVKVLKKAGETASVGEVIGHMEEAEEKEEKEEKKEKKEKEEKEEKKEDKKKEKAREKPKEEPAEEEEAEEKKRERRKEGEEAEKEEGGPRA